MQDIPEAAKFAIQLPPAREPQERTLFRLRPLISPIGHYNGILPFGGATLGVPYFVHPPKQTPNTSSEGLDPKSPNPKLSEGRTNPEP